MNGNDEIERVLTKKQTLEFYKQRNGKDLEEFKYFKEVPKVKPIKEIKPPCCLYLLRSPKTNQGNFFERKAKQLHWKPSKSRKNKLTPIDKIRVLLNRVGMQIDNESIILNMIILALSVIFLLSCILFIK